MSEFRVGDHVTPTTSRFEHLGLVHGQTYVVERAESSAGNVVLRDLPHPDDDPEEEDENDGWSADYLTFDPRRVTVVGVQRNGDFQTVIFSDGSSIYASSEHVLDAFGYKETKS